MPNKYPLPLPLSLPLPSPLTLTLTLTGDRLTYSPFADLPASGYAGKDVQSCDYSEDIFPQCSHDAQKCLDAIYGTVQEAIQMMHPGPSVAGEAEVRFVGSRFRLLLEAQILKWNETRC